MKNKIFRVVLLTLVFVLIASINIFAYIDRDYEYQQSSNWCWVATAKNLVIGERPISNPPTISQTEAVIEIMGTAADDQGSVADTIDAAEYISENQYGYQSSDVLSFETLRSLTETLASPAGFFIYNSSARIGHQLIMYGAATSNTIYLFDSASGMGEKSVNYYDFVEGNSRYYLNYTPMTNVYCTAHYW